MPCGKGKKKPKGKGGKKQRYYTTYDDNPTVGIIPMLSASVLLEVFHGGKKK